MEMVVFAIGLGSGFSRGYLLSTSSSRNEAALHTITLSG